MKMQPKSQNPYYQAQAILARRDHSVHEITQKLRRKKFSPGQIKSAIKTLQDQGLLNDAKFARLYTDSLLLSKPVGPRYLKSKLAQKGISSNIIATILNETYSPSREEELTKEAITRWRRSHPRHANDKQKLARFLASRGFSHNAIDAAEPTYTS